MHKLTINNTGHHIIVSRVPNIGERIEIGQDTMTVTRVTSRYYFHPDGSVVDEFFISVDYSSHS